MKYKNIGYMPTEEDNIRYDYLNYYDAWHADILPCKYLRNYSMFCYELKQRIKREDYDTETDYKIALLENADYTKLCGLEVDVFIWDITDYGVKDSQTARILVEPHTTLKIHDMLIEYVKNYYKENKRN